MHWELERKLKTTYMLLRNPKITKGILIGKDKKGRTSGGDRGLRGHVGDRVGAEVGEESRKSLTDWWRPRFWSVLISLLNPLNLLLLGSELPW